MDKKEEENKNKHGKIPYFSFFSSCQKNSEI